MIASSVSKITLPSLFADIIARDQLPYDRFRLKTSELNHLRQAAREVMACIRTQLPPTYHVVGSTIDTLFLQGERLVEIPKIAGFTIAYAYFPIGMYKSPSIYAAWDGTKLHCRNAITCRRDIPNEYKIYFEQLVLKYLLGEECTSSFPADDHHAKRVHNKIAQLLST